MRKTIAVVLAAAFLVAALPMTSQAKVDREPGGIMAFIVGMCWGLREGTQWNEGADMHMREWLRIVPIVNIVVAIWDGVECMQGITAHEWAEANGANWY